MSTQLGTYCKQFDATLRPVLQDLAGAAAAIGAAAHTVAKPLHAPLLDLHHQLEALCDKVAEQQAYVLIFGPLKSGKSTLMNAIAAAYVSEVSSLPAYPCLVFVRAGEERSYTATSYDGAQRTFAAGRERDIFEHMFQVGVRNADGRLVRAVGVTSSAGAWSRTFSYSVAGPQAGTLEAVDLSEKDGALSCIVQVRVHLAPP